MMRSIIVALAFVTLIPRVNASGVGNGGFVVKCGEKYQLLEYYEAEQNGSRFESLEGFDLTTKVRSLLTRLQRVDPNRSLNYGFQFSQWNLVTKELSAPVLRLSAAQAEDPYLQRKFGFGPVKIAADCELDLAIQQLSPAVADNSGHSMRLEIFRDVWRVLDEDTQAALVLHELFYYERILRKVEPITSTGVRNLNGLLGSTDFAKVDIPAWNKMLRDNEFSPFIPTFTVEPEGLRRWAFSMPYHGEYIGLEWKNDDYLSYNGGAMNFDGSLRLCGQDYPVTTSASFFLNGEIPIAAQFRNAPEVDFSCYSLTGKIKIQMRGCSVKMARHTGVQPSVVDLAEAGEGCDAYLVNYDNPSLKLIGNPKASISNQAYKQHFTTRLKVVATPFSDVQVLIDGRWTTVQKECEIELKTGKVLSIDGTFLSLP